MSEGEVVDKVEEEPVVVEPETCEESVAHVTCAEGEESDAGKKEQILADLVRPAKNRNTSPKCYLCKNRRW